MLQVQVRHKNTVFKKKNLLKGSEKALQPKRTGDTSVTERVLVCKWLCFDLRGGVDVA